jgi:hypothetical protein
MFGNIILDTKKHGMTSRVDKIPGGHCRAGCFAAVLGA